MDLLHVQPEVGLRRELRRQLVVLPVVAADEDPETVGRTERHRLAGRQLHALFPVRLAHIAPGGQLRPDLLHVTGRFRPRKLFQHARQILQLLFAAGDLLGQDLLGGLRLLVVLIEFCRVLLRRDGRVQRNFDLPHVRVIEIGGAQLCLAALDGVEVGRQDIAQAAQALAVMGRRQLPALVLELARRAGDEVRQRLAHGL